MIYAGDFRQSLMKIKDKVDVFLLDPPYDSDYYNISFEMIKEYDLLAEDGIIVAEHRNDVELGEEIAGFELLKERKYGNIVLSIYG